MNTLTTAKEHISGQLLKKLFRKSATHKPVQAGQYGVIQQLALYLAVAE